MTTSKTDGQKWNVHSIYDDLVAKATDHVGGDKGFSVIGPNIRRAMVALEIVAFQQRMKTMGIADDKLVKTTDALYGELNDQFPWED